MAELIAEPIGLKDVVLSIRGRPDFLPRIYKAKNHPQRGSGNVFYYVQDVSPEGMKLAFEIEERMQIPHGPAELARKLGEYYLDPHTTIIKLNPPQVSSR